MCKIFVNLTEFGILSVIRYIQGAPCSCPDSFFCHKHCMHSFMHLFFDFNQSGNIINERDAAIVYFNLHGDVSNDDVKKV